MANLQVMQGSRRCLVDVCSSRVQYTTNTLHYISAIFAFLICLTVSSTSAGDCWAERSSSFNTCKSLLKKNVTKEQCCKYNGEGISWTVESYSDSDIFKFTNLQNGIPYCMSCRGESGHESCDQIDCGKDKKCVMKSDKPKCVCAPNCTRSELDKRGELCGSDGRRYKNKCAMLKERCRTGNDELKVAYYGRCEASCTGVRCGYEQLCMEDQYGRPWCVDCNDLCKHETFGLPVCGLDGITYESKCHLQRSSCFLGIDIPLLHKGRCENLTSCDDMSCLENKQCVMDGVLPRCVLCSFKCTGWKLRGPICATDEVTYYNWCHLQDHICNTTKYLRIEGYGICEEELISYWIPEDGSENSADDNSMLSQWRQMLRGSGQEDEDDIENYDDFSDNNSTAPAENSTTTTDASVEGAYTTESAHPEDAFDVPP